MSVTEQIVDHQTVNRNSHVTMIKEAVVSISIRLVQISHALASTPTLFIFNLEESQAPYGCFSLASSEDDHLKGSLERLCTNAFQPMTSYLAVITNFEHKTTIDDSGSRDEGTRLYVNVM